MSQALPLPSQCGDACEQELVVNIPGVAGADGAAGADGSDGLSAYSLVLAQYVQPAVGADVTVSVSSSVWMAIGQVVYVQNGGYYTVQSKPTSTSVSLRNLGYTGNVAPTTVVALGNTVAPAGIKGTDGAAPSTDINDFSPTTTKGDIMVDNGANSPNASVIRLAAPTNTYVWTADSTQASGWLAKNPKLTATGTLNFGSIASTASEDLTIALAGAAVGDPVTLGLPAAPAAGIVFMAFVSAVDVVTVRAMNITGAPVDPASADYTVRINKL